MALLGRLIDKQTISRVGDALTGVTLAGFAHSLATNPDLVLPVARSIAELGHQPGVNLLGVGGNSSQATVGYVIGSTASAPTLMYDLYAILFHTIVR